MQSIFRTWFYDIAFGFEFIVRGREKEKEKEKEREGFLTYQNGNNSSCQCFDPAASGMVMVSSCFLASLFVYMSVLTIKVKRKKKMSS